jgi:hypothetical protein
MRQEFYFFQTMIDLSKSLATTENAAAHMLDGTSLLNLAAFRDFVMERLGLRAETIKLFAPLHLRYVCKPQKLLFDHPEFYIANDYVTNTCAICYRDLTMVDVDLPPVVGDDGDEDDESVLDFSANYLAWLIQQCEIHKTWRFGVYRSRKGLHVFILHQVFESRDDRANFQLQLKCDFYYALFTYLRHGCSVRLNAKKGENLPLYHFVGFLGYGQTVPRLEQLMEFHTLLPPLFQHMGPSRMK